MGQSTCLDIFFKNPTVLPELRDLNTGFCLNRLAAFAGAFGGGFKLAAGGHDIFAAWLADRAGVACVENNI